MENKQTSSKVRYRNPWHEPGGGQHYGPEFYETDAEPMEYRGYLVYLRLPEEGVDIVKDGVCVTQRGARSLRGKAAETIRRVIDEIIRTGNPRAMPQDIPRART